MQEQVAMNRESDAAAAVVASERQSVQSRQSRTNGELVAQVPGQLMVLNSLLRVNGRTTDVMLASRSAAKLPSTERGVEASVQNEEAAPPPEASSSVLPACLAEARVAATAVLLEEASK
jgi:hypothetical protein